MFQVYLLSKIKISDEVEVEFYEMEVNEEVAEEATEVEEDETKN